MKMLSLAMLAILCVSLVGCGPQLAQTPYGEPELTWHQYLSESYPEWKPPQTLPPTNMDSTEDDATMGPVAPTAAPEDLTIEVQETVVTTTPPPIVTDAPAPVDTAPLATEDVQIYKVQKNDTLWGIAKKFYQSGADWKRIQEANPDLLANPKDLKAGMELRIPAK